MRSMFGAVALVIGSMMLAGCCSMNNNCDSAWSGYGGGGAAWTGSCSSCGSAGACGGQCGGAAPCNTCDDSTSRWSGVFLDKGQASAPSCGQCNVGRSLLLGRRGFSLPSWPKYGVGVAAEEYQSCGSAVGSCANGACGCGSGGPIINGLDNLKAGIRSSFGGGCDCGNGACQGGCGVNGYAAGDNQGGYGAPYGGSLNNLGSGPIGQFVGDVLPFSAIRGVNHPYGKQVPHTADATVGYQAPGGGVAPTYAYPYYTTRGPRDFLVDGCGPPPIVPYRPKTTCLPSIGF